ncbi:MAG: fibronectin type III domain-containing protein [Geobacteraceae bacterium]|nr:fibronectin type III domain-containing protein [Geobacteraceae bacterium]
MKKFLLIIAICFLAGCGKKGALVPPEALAPAAVADLKVEQQGERFLVSWSRPAREEGGGPLRDLAGFRLFRRELLPPGEDCEECPSAYRQVVGVDLEYPRGVLVLGERYLFPDADLTTGKSYRYKAVSFKRDGTQSRDSNRAGRKMVAPPRPPMVQATPSPSGVGLEWQPPEAPANGRIEGYNVYRKRAGEEFYVAPLTGAPLRETTFEDRRLERGTGYDYAVRTVAVVEGETVESDLSNEVRGALTEPE